jgi:hypothetical protein
MRRETSAFRSAADGNKLSGTLPAALGALTDLVVLCARPSAIMRGGEGPARPRSAESARSRARAVLRSYLGSNGFTGTIGGWIGSLAKLTFLYARARACTGGYPRRRRTRTHAAGYCHTCVIAHVRSVCERACVFVAHTCA